MTIKHCLNCNKQLIDRSFNQVKKFCNYYCKKNFTLAKRRKDRIKNIEKQCAYCGKTFIQKFIKEVKYCSRKCCEIVSWKNFEVIRKKRRKTDPIYHAHERQIQKQWRENNKEKVKQFSKKAQSKESFKIKRRAWWKIYMSNPTIHNKRKDWEKKWRSQDHVKEKKKLYKLNNREYISIKGREYSKFIFTKVLSYILNIIKNLLKIHEIDIEKGSNLDIKIFKEIYSNLKSKSISDILKDNIKINEENYKVHSYLNLPQIIFNKDDIFEYNYINNKPTFITNKKIKCEVVYIKDNNYNKLDNKIICIKNADPGWEWLFSRNICGIITCFGGMNSHISIRCEELSIPAVIGCGPEKFEIYKDSSIIELNCRCETVNILI